MPEETVNEETVSEETTVEAGSTDEDQSQVDYQSLYEKAETDRKNLESLIGRQGNELGQLRKLIEQNQSAGNIPKEIDPYQYFDDDTVKAIDKIVEEKAQKLYESKSKETEDRQLRNDFQAVMNEYEVTDDNLADLAYYAASKGLNLKKAAEDLSKKQILNKRTTPRTQYVSGIAPTGPPKVATSGSKDLGEPAKMSLDQWQKLTNEQREAYLKKYGG